MNKSVPLGIATAIFACCLCASVSAGTLKAAAAEAISEPKLSDSKFESRGLSLHGGGHGGHGGGGGAHGGWSGGGPGGWGGPGLGGHGEGPLHGNESFTGPTVIALALPIAVALIVALWVAAYNTLRSPPPKVGYNAGIVEQAGWGGAQANIAAGYGQYDAASTDQHAALASNLAATTLVQAAATQGGVAAGRAFDELTHRVTRSIANFSRKQKKH